MKKFKINKVLLSTDFSQLKQSAVETAVAICSRQNAELTIIHVLDEATDLNSKEPLKLDEKQKSDFFHIMENEFKTIVENFSKQYNLEIILMIGRGKPAEIVCKVAVEGNFNLIIVDEHGFMGIRKGKKSNASDIFTNAPCPVLLVPENWNKFSFSKIVYPIRMNQKVFQKYNYVEPIIEKNNSELIVVGLADKDKPEHIKGTVFSVDLLRNMCMEKKIHYSTFILPCNNFSSKLIDIANEVDSDLLVISSNIDYDSKENFIAHFAHDIIEQSKLPVLLISPLLDSKKS